MQITLDSYFVFSWYVAKRGYSEYAFIIQGLLRVNSESSKKSSESSDPDEEKKTPTRLWSKKKHDMAAD